MSVAEVLLPVFVHVLLVFILLFWMGKERRGALVTREVQMKDIALDEPNWPKKATQLGNCLKNQFEFPVLFYALCAFLAVTKRTTLFLLACAWGYVVLRSLHAYIHLTSNQVIRRFQAYVASSVVLFVMWGVFAVRLATN